MRCLQFRFVSRRPSKPLPLAHAQPPTQLRHNPPPVTPFLRPLRLHERTRTQALCTLPGNRGLRFTPTRDPNTPTGSPRPCGGKEYKHSREETPPMFILTFMYLKLTYLRLLLSSPLVTRTLPKPARITSPLVPHAVNMACSWHCCCVVALCAPARLHVDAAAHCPAAHLTVPYRSRLCLCPCPCLCHDHTERDMS